MVKIDIVTIAGMISLLSHTYCKPNPGWGHRGHGGYQHQIRVNPNRNFGWRGQQVHYAPQKTIIRIPVRTDWGPHYNTNPSPQIVIQNPNYPGNFGHYQRQQNQYLPNPIIQIVDHSKAISNSTKPVIPDINGQKGQMHKPQNSANNWSSNQNQGKIDDSKKHQQLNSQAVDQSSKVKDSSTGSQTGPSVLIVDEAGPVWAPDSTDSAIETVPEAPTSTTTTTKESSSKDSEYYENYDEVDASDISKLIDIRSGLAPSV